MPNYLQVHGLTSQHKEFLQRYAQEKLGTPSRTKAILHLIETAMSNEKSATEKNSRILIDDETRKNALAKRKKQIEEHQQKLSIRENKINQARLENNHQRLAALHKDRITLKKKRLQLSLPVYDYEFLEKLAKESDSSIQHYLTVIIMEYLYNRKKLLGKEIEALRASNYELYKIGVNVNQIAKANNAGDMVELPINRLYNAIQTHINKVKIILNASTDIY
ncbi:hypothetical protein A9308_08945 [Moraxella atlantae]|uniref:Bacterial mobilisation domain-containing protein n=1 Tax=Faucicola atlantae TaxID=34059 RepID=A0A1B8QAE2_9GAMM|nr:plasmid mobilization relaxosome protein MobC [Moraxella atlantae]OBX76252.1 hypothetical protein A9308_08945 [Moraxella atlantae]